MKLFKYIARKLLKSPPPRAGSLLPEESTQDRARLIDMQWEKLRRAEELKLRSSAVAASLQEENAINHYVERLRLAYTKGSR